MSSLLKPRGKRGDQLNIKRLEEATALVMNLTAYIADSNDSLLERIERCVENGENPEWEEFSEILKEIHGRLAGVHLLLAKARESA